MRSSHHEALDYCSRFLKNKPLSVPTQLNCIELYVSIYLRTSSGSQVIFKSILRNKCALCYTFLKTNSEPKDDLRYVETCSSI
jgi:hypothetical protein